MTKNSETRSGNLDTQTDIKSGKIIQSSRQRQTDGIGSDNVAPMLPNNQRTNHYWQARQADRDNQTELVGHTRRVQTDRSRQTDKADRHEARDRQIETGRKRQRQN